MSKFKSSTNIHARFVQSTAQVKYKRTGENLFLTCCRGIVLGNSKRDQMPSSIKLCCVAWNHFKICRSTENSKGLYSLNSLGHGCLTCRLFHSTCHTYHEFSSSPDIVFSYERTQDNTSTPLDLASSRLTDPSSLASMQTLPTRGRMQDCKPTKLDTLAKLMHMWLRLTRGFFYNQWMCQP